MKNMNTIQKVLHKATSRGTGDHGWLKTNFSFSFADYHNPDRMGFGLLRVLNDDIIDPGYGFSMHPHRNMEIISVPLSGALQHKDSGGHEEIIRKNEIQVMSAGAGVYHSEYNASDTEHAKLLQIWIFPREVNVTPRYDQKAYDPAARDNKFQTIVTSEENEDTLWIHQDARLSLANIRNGSSLEYKKQWAGHGVYLFLISGKVDVESEILEQRDAMGITDSEDINISALADSEILAIEVPMN
jgi:quercetin 2,3-dioxygenase